MNRGIYPILSGALAQERQMQVFSNNVANVNTAGFKQDESMFRSLVARSMGQVAPTGAEERVFVTAQGLKTVLDNGRFRKTGNPYDLAIRGSGFFEVKTAQGLRYTRNGVFHLDGQRRLGGERAEQVEANAALLAGAVLPDSLFSAINSMPAVPERIVNPTLWPRT